MKFSEVRELENRVQIMEAMLMCVALEKGGELVITSEQRQELLKDAGNVAVSFSIDTETKIWKCTTKKVMINGDARV